MISMTLQEEAEKLGISRQAFWLKTEKGKAYQKAYHEKTHVSVKKLRELGVIK